MKLIKLITGVLVIALPLSAEDTAAIRLTADAQVVTVGAEFTVSVTIDSDEFVNLGEVILEFDHRLLRPTGIDTTGSRFTFDVIEQLGYATGKVRIIRGEPHRTTPKGQDLSFCTVSFRVIGASETASVGVDFSAPGEDGDSAVYKDDGVPTDILTSVQQASVEIILPKPRPVSGRVEP